MFMNQRNAPKMTEEMKMEMVAEKKKIRLTAPLRVIRKAGTKARRAKASSPGAAVPIKALPTPPKVIVTTIIDKKATGAETVAEPEAAPADDDVSVCTDITEWTDISESAWGIDAILEYNKIMAVVGSWDKVKAKDGYEEALGEQIILKMMELEPGTRGMLGLTSLRSPQFAIVSINMVNMIDAIVSFIGPDMEQIDDDLLDVGKLYISEGFHAKLFPFLRQSVCSGLKVVLAEAFSPPTEDAWNTVINFMAKKMSPA
jgi:hypothetical protein